MSTPISLTWGTWPNGTCWPGSPQDFITTLATLLSGVVPGTYNSFVIGASTPAPDDQDKPWIKLDNSGFPIGMYVYAGGFWVRPHPVPASSKSRIIWIDTEANLWAYDGGDGTDPGVSAPTAATGAMWQRDTAFNFRMPLGMGTNSTAYDSNPATTVNPGDTGGVERNTIAEANLPLFDPGLKSDVGSDLVWVADHATGPSKQGVGVGAFNGGAQYTSNEMKLTSSYGQATPTTVNNLPPFIGVIFAKRTSRIYYQG